MHNYNNLQDEGIFKYGSDEIMLFEKRLTQYFSREYKRYNSSDISIIRMDQGPIALAATELANNHYNEGIPFFQSFLDARTMSYTMAYFGESYDEALSSNKSLEQAQIDKFELMANRMALRGDEKLLNIGCGFGYFESFLLEQYPQLEVSSTTHSKDQFEFIQHRMRQAEDPLSGERFHLYFGEINNDSSNILGKEQYDVVCSAGLLEQINNIELLFEIIYELLVENGKMFHHLIMSRDLIPKFLDPDKTLIGDYFPGGRVLPFAALKRDFKNLRVLDSWFINGMNYWKTLDKWHENFWKNLDEVYPGKMDIERVRYWNNYFVLCKAMFFPENGSAYGNGQFLYQKQSNLD